MLFQLFKDVQKNPLKPVMALIGGDGFVRQKLRELLVDRALGEALRDMNHSKFYAGEDSLARAMDACRDYPCFAERRVVLLLEIEKLKKKEAGQLITYLKDPQPSTLLLIEGEKVDGRLEWGKLLKKTAYLVEIPEATLRDSVAWVRKCFEREGKQVEEGVVERLVGLTGNHLGSLQQAVTQTSLYVGDRKVINFEDLDRLLIKVSEENVFAVIDSLFAGNPSQLHRSLNRMLESGEPPLKILALVNRHLSILLSLRFGQRGETWRIFRMPPFLRQQYEQQVRRFGQKLDYRLLKPIAQADQELKGSPLPKELLLKNCVEQVGNLLS